MNNEPVAWMQIHYKDKMCVTKLSPVKTWEDDVPLYTHPAKTLETDCYGDGNVYRGVRSKDSAIQTIHIDSTAKTLTDEEINELANKYLYVLNDVPYANDIKDFAKAILRKAQEK